MLFPSFCVFDCLECLRLGCGRAIFRAFLVTSNGVSQGQPLSYTLLSVCIDELERIITMFVKGGIENFVTTNGIIMLFLHTSHGAFANTLRDAQ